MVLTVAEMGTLFRMTPAGALIADRLERHRRRSEGPSGEPVEQWRAAINARAEDLDGRLEQIDLALVECRVFLEELMARQAQARDGLDGWSP